MCCHNHNSQSNDPQKQSGPSVQKKKPLMFWIGLIGVMLFVIWGLVSAPGMGDKLKTLLPSLAFLICPLMMLFMMRRHGHDHGSNKDSLDKDNKSCH